MVSDELLRRYRRQIATYRDRTARHLTTAWDDLPGIDESNIAEFERVIATPLGGAKTAAVALSAAFFALGLGIRPVGVNPRDVKAFADTRGPFRAAWHALSMGRSFEEALFVGRSTSEAIGFDFVQSAARLTGDVVAERSGRSVRWVRVPDPGACEWCQLVAEQSYASAESADFGHERCGCDAVPE